MRRILWLSTIIFFSMLGCAAAPMYVYSLDNFDREAYFESIDCLEYFSQNRLDCMDKMAAMCFENGLDRHAAKRWSRRCMVYYNPRECPEFEWCIDKVLDRYYGD